MDKVIVVQNSGEKSAFPAGTEKEIHAAALWILESRKMRGFYNPPKKPEPLAYNIQYIKKIPAEYEQIREFIRVSIADAKSREVEYAKSESFMELVNSTIASGDGATAWQILNDRKYKEGEKFEIMNVIVPQSRESEEMNE